MDMTPIGGSFRKAFDAVIEAGPISHPRASPYIGKLGFKEEAAGKVRVFAMVDC
jgi:hypothetical protein